MLYADHAASAPLRPAARAAAIHAMDEGFANPSGIHASGQAAAHLRETARESVAADLGCGRGEVFFTSGGTESNNWAISAAARLGPKQGRNRVLVGATEHLSVLNVAKELEAQGFALTLLPVDAMGILRLDILERALGEDTALVSVQWVNNETGAVQPVASIAGLCHAHGALFHTDAVQAVGPVAISFEACGADLLTLSGHKLGGLKGSGALLCCRGLKLPPLLYGGHQEDGLRPGTENLPGIASLAASLRESCGNREREAARVSALRRELLEGLDGLKGWRLMSPDVNGPILGLLFDGLDGEALALHASLAKVYISSGAACTSGQPVSSHVLRAMGIPEDAARGFARVSLGWSNRPGDGAAVAQVLRTKVTELRR